MTGAIRGANKAKELKGLATAGGQLASWHQDATKVKREGLSSEQLHQLEFLKGYQRKFSKFVES